MTNNSLEVIGKFIPVIHWILNIIWTAKIIAKTEFSGLQSLQQLSLRKNRIHEIEVDALRILPELTTLDLGENRLSAVPRDAFRDLVKLFRLDLCCNGIRTFRKGTFKEKVNNILLYSTSHSCSLGRPIISLVHAISDNTLICDNRLDWFMTYLDTNGIRTSLPDQPEVLCFGKRPVLILRWISWNFGVIFKILSYFGGPI